MNRTKNEKSKDYCKADLRQHVLFFITIFRLAIPAFFRFTDVYVMFRPRFLQLIYSFIIEQTRFLSTVFLNNEFKLEDIYSGVNFGCFLGENTWIKSPTTVKKVGITYQR